MTIAPGAYVIGRDERCDVVVSDESVSARHAVLDVDARGEMTLRDLGSRNGTFIRRGGEWHRLDAARHPVQLDSFVAFGECQLAIADVVVPFRRAAAAPDQVAPVARHTSRQWREFGFYDARVPTPQARHGSMVGAAMIVAGTLGAILALAVAATEVGIIQTFIAVFIAFIPVVFYTALWLWLDRYDPEPPWALAAAFAWGAGVAIVFSLFVNTMAGIVGGAIAGPAVGTIASAVISAPLAEEGSKAAGLLIIFFFLRRHFDGVLDGIVYAGIIALGFATIENVSYYGRAMNSSALLGTFFLRGVLFPFCHSLFTSMTGIGLGIARENARSAIRWIAPIAGYVAAVTLHAFWNGLNVILGDAVIFADVLLWMPLFLAFVVYVIVLMRREVHILRRTLARDVTEGLISAEQLRVVVSIPRRVMWQAQALSEWSRFYARRRFLRAVSRLGLSYWHVERALKAGAQTISMPEVSRLRNEIVEWRARI